MSAADRKLRYRINNGEILPPDTPALTVGFKDPLTPIKKGFGFYGTLAYNEAKTHTQCFICGFFFENLGIHVSKIHGKKARDYRLEYGLGAQTSLVAPVTRQKYVRYWESLTAEQREQKAQQLAATRSQTQRELSLKGAYAKKSLYKKNQEGRCPEQLLDKIKTLRDKLGATPSGRRFVEEYGEGYMGSVRLTFGSWTEALKILDLVPHKSGRKNSHSKQSILQQMIDFQLRYGREPYTKDLTSGLLPSHFTFNRYFGGLEAARELLRTI